MRQIFNVAPVVSQLRPRLYTNREVQKLSKYIVPKNVVKFSTVIMTQEKDF